MNMLHEALQHTQTANTIRYRYKGEQSDGYRYNYRPPNASGSRTWLGSMRRLKAQNNKRQSPETQSRQVWAKDSRTSDAAGLKTQTRDRGRETEREGETDLLPARLSLSCTCSQLATVAVVVVDVVVAVSGVGGHFKATWQLAGAPTLWPGELWIIRPACYLTVLIYLAHRVIKLLTVCNSASGFRIN